MEELGTVKGYTYTTEAEDMDSYTKLVLDEIDKSTEGFAWWEAKMPSEIWKQWRRVWIIRLTAAIRTECFWIWNSVLEQKSNMSAEEYMQSIQDVYEMNK